MANQGLSGFLVKKTCQPHSLRVDHSNYNEYRKSNLVVYLNKRVGDLRNKSGTNVLSKQAMTQMTINMKPDGQQKQIRPEAYKLERSVVEMLRELLPEQEETVGGKVKERKSALTTEQKLKLLMNNEFQGPQNVEHLFAQYKRKNLQTNLNEMRAKLQAGKRVNAKHELTKNNLKEIELVDDEQINFFMQQICRETGINAAIVLGVREKEGAPQMKFDAEEEQWEKMKNIIQKRITKEELHRIIEREEEQQKRRLIENYKETKLDNFETDIRKNRMSMITMKRISEAQERVYGQKSGSADMQQNRPKSSFTRDPQKYTRKFLSVVSPVKQMIKQPNLMVATEGDVGKSPIPHLRPTTASSATKSHGTFITNSYYVGKNTKVPNASDHKEPISSFISKQQKQSTDKSEQLRHIQNFVDQCIALEDSNHKFSENFNRKLHKLNDQFSNSVRSIERYQNIQNQISSENQAFTQYLKQSKFKNKLINYLLQKAPNKQDLLSQKVIDQQTKEVIDSMLP